uniref:WAP domain-containing protein n=1 Tax=Panagrellus redivivus TaxID=6233 RepID=A0A7E4VWY9_PANRE
MQSLSIIFVLLISIPLFCDAYYAVNPYSNPDDAIASWDVCFDTSECQGKPCYCASAALGIVPEVPSALKEVPEVRHFYCYDAYTDCRCLAFMCLCTYKCDLSVNEVEE